MTTHAKLSASGAHRWMNCSGSIKAEQGYPDTSSPYAQEGTLAHELAEAFLKTEKHPDGASDEMYGYVYEYTDYIQSLMSNEGAMLYVEQKVSYEHITPGGFGTCDAIVHENLPEWEYDTLHIVDLKYGRGVPVYAEDNPQLMLYAAGACKSLDIHPANIELHIVQPRIGNYSSHTIKLRELKEFEDFARERAELALSPNAPRTPGEKQCQWCKAKADCKALYDYTAELIKRDSDLFEDPDTMTDEHRRDLLDNKKLIVDFLSAVEEDVYDRLHSGKSFEGYKLIEGRTTRKWKDGAEDALVNELGGAAYNTKLIGITEAQRQIGKDKVDELTERTQGSPKLVPESHKSPAYTAFDQAALFAE